MASQQQLQQQQQALSKSSKYDRTGNKQQNATADQDKQLLPKLSLGGPATSMQMQFMTSTPAYDYNQLVRGNSGSQQESQTGGLVVSAKRPSLTSRTHHQSHHNHNHSTSSLQQLLPVAAGQADQQQQATETDLQKAKTINDTQLIEQFITQSSVAPIKDNLGSTLLDNGYHSGRKGGRKLALSNGHQQIPIQAHLSSNLNTAPGQPENLVTSSTPMEINKKLNKKRHESTTQITGRLRKVPSIFAKPDKSVQFAQENTILVIDDDNQLLANGQVVPRSHQNAMMDEQIWFSDSRYSKPILKNGPNSKTEKMPGNVQRMMAMNKDIDQIVKQQEASRQFFNQFTDRMQQRERQQKEKLAQSWKSPPGYSHVNLHGLSEQRIYNRQSPTILPLHSQSAHKSHHGISYKVVNNQPSQTQHFPTQTMSTEPQMDTNTESMLIDQRRYSALVEGEITPLSSNYQNNQTDSKIGGEQEVPAIGGGLISKLVRKVTPMRKSRRERLDSNNFIAVAAEQSSSSKQALLSPYATKNDRVLIGENDLSPQRQSSSQSQLQNNQTNQVQSPIISNNNMVIKLQKEQISFANVAAANSNNIENPENHLFNHQNEEENAINADIEEQGQAPVQLSPKNQTANSNNNAKNIKIHLDLESNNNNKITNNGANAINTDSSQIVSSSSKIQTKEKFKTQRNIQSTLLPKLNNKLPSQHSNAPPMKQLQSLGRNVRISTNTSIEQNSTLKAVSGSKQTDESNGGYPTQSSNSYQKSNKNVLLRQSMPTESLQKIKELYEVPSPQALKAKFQTTHKMEGVGIQSGQAVVLNGGGIAFGSAESEKEEFRNSSYDNHKIVDLGPTPPLRIDGESSTMTADTVVKSLQKAASKISKKQGYSSKQASKQALIINQQQQHQQRSTMSIPSRSHQTSQHSSKQIQQQKQTQQQQKCIGKSSDRVLQELNKLVKGLPQIQSPKIKKSPLLSKEQIQMLLKIKHSQQKEQQQHGSGAGSSLTHQPYGGGSSLGGATSNAISGGTVGLITTNTASGVQTIESKTYDQSFLNKRISAISVNREEQQNSRAKNNINISLITGGQKSKSQATDHISGPNSQTLASQQQQNNNTSNGASGKHNHTPSIAGGKQPQILTTRSTVANKNQAGATSSSRLNYVRQQKNNSNILVNSSRDLMLNQKHENLIYNNADIVVGQSASAANDSHQRSKQNLSSNKNLATMADHQLLPKIELNRVNSLNHNQQQNKNKNINQNNTIQQISSELEQMPKTKIQQMILMDMTTLRGNKDQQFVIAASSGSGEILGTNGGTAQSSKKNLMTGNATNSNQLQSSSRGAAVSQSANSFLAGQYHQSTTTNPNSTSAVALNNSNSTIMHKATVQPSQRISKKAAQKRTAKEAIAVFHNQQTSSQQSQQQSHQWDKDNNFSNSKVGGSANLSSLNNNMRNSAASAANNKQQQQQQNNIIMF